MSYQVIKFISFELEELLFLANLGEVSSLFALWGPKMNLLVTLFTCMCFAKLSFCE